METHANIMSKDTIVANSSNHTLPVDGTSQFRELDVALSFVAKHNWKFFQIVSLAFGFLIFLVYFCQNTFYPDFDLFSFISLLAAAAVLGGAVLAVVGFGFAAPGWIWSEMFFSDKGINEELKYRINKNTPKEKLDHRLTNRYFFFPASLCNLTLIVAIYFFDSDTAYTLGLVLTPIAVGLIFGFFVQKNYELPSWSWLKFAFTAFLTFFICNLVALLSTLKIDQAFPEITLMIGQYPFMILSFFITLVLLTFLTMCVRRDQRFLLLITPFLAFFLMLVTNTWAVLPSNIVNQLGIGNYEADQILLNSDTCEKYKAIPAYGVANDCALNNVHVVWSMGGLYSIRWASEGKLIKVKLPSAAIISTKLPEGKNPTRN